METPKLIVFDLDNTLTESKCPIDDEMAGLVCSLLDKKKVAVTSGASFSQIEHQFLDHLTCSKEELANLCLLPTNAASFLLFKNGWSEVYNETLTEAERKMIFNAFYQTFAETNFEMPEVLYGELIEDRQSQITFDGLGSTAPLPIKKTWDPDHTKRTKLIHVLEKLLPEFSISIGGTTSIDVTKKDITKAYGVQKLANYFNLQISDLEYVGDALFPGGNDAVVISTGVQTYSVSGPEETKKYIRELLIKQE